jgi:integrase
MGRKRPPGLALRGGIWHIQKQYGGTKLRESTGTGDLAKAEEYLAKRLDDLREARLYGLRQDRSFRAAATKYLAENTHKRSLDDDAHHLKALDPFIGGLLLKKVHMGSLQAFIDKRRADGVKAKTINSALEVVRRILNLSASEWIDENGLTWLQAAPKIRMLPILDARSPYPLTSQEQSLLLQRLPDHLAKMALFKVNTGCREQEVCGLRWEWEVEVPELDTSVFVIPSARVKNGEERLVVLNRVAASIVKAQRGVHRTHVFVRTFKEGPPRPVGGMNNTAWQRARELAALDLEQLTGDPAPTGFRNVRVHDLKHTFGRRLRAAGVSFEDRQDLLGHKSSRITTHYSQAELSNLIEAANRVCDLERHKTSPTTWLKRKSG